jgi:hypothetical protein
MQASPEETFHRQVAACQCRAMLCAPTKTTHIASLGEALKHFAIESARTGERWNGQPTSPGLRAMHSASLYVNRLSMPLYLFLSLILCDSASLRLCFFASLCLSMSL